MKNDKSQVSMKNDKSQVSMKNDESQVCIFQSLIGKHDHTR